MTRRVGIQMRLLAATICVAACVDKPVTEVEAPSADSSFVQVSYDGAAISATPTSAIATFAGGTNFDAVRDVTIDAAGNIYMTGGTVSTNFITTAGVVQRVNSPGTPDNTSIVRSDAFITKIDPSGRVVWSTLLGGPNHDRAYAIEVDAQGFVYIAGRAGRNFPVTASAFQRIFQGGLENSGYGTQDGFVCKLRPDASAVVFCSYFGTPGDGRPIRDLVVNAAGEIFVTTGRLSGAYPTAIASKFLNGPRGAEDAVVAKIRSDGAAVLWARYLGGSSGESHQNSLRLDGSGNVYVLFTTKSSNAGATASAYQTTYRGNGDLFINKLNPTTGAVVWGTYFGGTGNESTETHELAVDNGGSVYIAAPATAVVPTTTTAFRRTFSGGGNDVFVAKLSPSGSSLVASTMFGGNGSDRPEGVAVDGAGVVYVTGTTTSTNFPLSVDAAQRTLRGGRDAFVVKLSSDFSQLMYSTYWGGSGVDYGRGMAANSSGFVLGGETTSRDNTNNNAFQPTYGGGAGDGFLLKFLP